MNYNTNEMLQSYEAILQDLLLSSSNVDEDWDIIKRTAMIELKKRYPDNQFAHARASDFYEAGKFYRDIRAIQNKFYTPKSKPAAKPISKTAQKPHKNTDEKKEPFIQILKKLAATGFIPQYETLIIFTNGNSPSRNTYISTVSDLKTEYGYQIERVEFGYRATPPEPKETPEQKARREAEERRQAEIAQIKSTIGELMAKLEAIK